MSKPVTITFLGGLGEIGRNCAAFEIDRRILLLDCGLMFPDVDMLGIDLVLPDFTWLRERADDIEGCIVTHGHEDHHGGLSFLLRELSFPIYGSALTLGLARNRIEEARLLDRTELIPVADGERRKIGPFDVEFIPVTHSVPHGFATAFHTPQGVILHTGDFKLDLTPVDGRLTDLARVGSLSHVDGVRLLLADSTNADEKGYSRSESSVGGVLAGLFASYAGKRIITTCFASHIHRVQQIADAAIAQGRTIATMGMSMKKNVRLAREMGLLHIPENRLVDIDDVGDLDPAKVCIISTGSQGEPMSALALMAANENRGSSWARRRGHHELAPHPGQRVQRLQGHRRPGPVGAEVVHSGIEDVHATGHAKQEELKTFHSIARPGLVHPRARRVPPPGGPRPHRPPDGHAQRPRHGLRGRRPAAADRRRPGAPRPVPAGTCTSTASWATWATACCATGGCWPRRGWWSWWWRSTSRTGAIITGPEVITRGWVYEAEAEGLLDRCEEAVADAVKEVFARDTHDIESIQRAVRRAAGKFVNDKPSAAP